MNVKPARLSIFLGMAALWGALVSYSSNPPDGHTGAPGDGLCTNCHTGGSALDGSITLQGLPPVIMPNTTYSIQVTVSNPNAMAARAGFQWAALDNFNNNAGNISNPSASSVITPSGGRIYHEHNPAKIYTGSTQLSWTAEWTSPAASPVSQTITLYGAGVIGSGGDGSGGDLVVTTQLSATLPAQGAPLSAGITGVVPPDCNGGSDGQASVEASGGAMPYSYLWSNGNTSATATNLPAGTVAVTVTDAAMNIAVASATISQPAPVQLSAASIQGIDCDTPSGSATVMASGGTPGYSYAWPNGETGATAMSLPAGNNVVTVTDANGCPKTLSVFIPQNISPPTAEAGQGGTLNCTTTQLMLNGSAPGCPDCTFSWAAGAGGNILSGANTATPVVNAAGAYTLTITNPLNGCTGTDSAAVSQTAPPTLALAGSTNVSCNGGADGAATVTALQGNPPYAFAWPSGGASDNESGLAAGTYIVSVSDEDGCTDTVAVSISEPAALSLNLSFSGETAAGANDGQASVLPTGGVGPYALNWSNGSTDTMISGLAPGLYQVTLEDANGCQAVESFVINSFDCTLSVVIVAGQPSCNGAADGFALASAQNAAPPWNMQWSNGATTDTITGLAAGLYSLTLTDANNCQAMATTLLSQPDALALELATIDARCNGAADGAASLTVSGGTAPYTYAWPSGSTAPSETGLGPGLYEVTATDAAGCQGTAQAVISEPPALQIVFDEVGPAANGMPNGNIAVTVAGGVGAYSFQWLLGGQEVGATEDIDGLAPGIYTLIVTDGNGCTLEAEAEVGNLTTGREAEAGWRFSLMPNPTSGLLWLDVQLDAPASLKASLLNMSGAEVLRREYPPARGHRQQLNLRELPAGLYLLRIEAQGKYRLQQLVLRP